MICTLCRQHSLEHGTLCPDCTRATLDRLTRLPRIWASLEAWLTPGTGGPAQYGGRVRLAEAPLPLNTEVLDLRAAGGIAGVLEDWHDAVRATRGMTTPVREGSLAHRVARAAAALAGHMHFIALWEQGGEFGREVQRLVDRVHAAVEPGRDREKPTLLGHCIAVDASGTVCGNRLYADMTRPVQCDWCLCLYPPDRWLALRLHQPGPPPPAEETAPGARLEPAA
jgi:hypothetical protein